jgi:hypothetical protein
MSLLILQLSFTKNHAFQNFCRYGFNIKSIATNARASGKGSLIVLWLYMLYRGSEEGDEAMILIAVNAFTFIQHLHEPVLWRGDYG